MAATVAEGQLLPVSGHHLPKQKALIRTILFAQNKALTIPAELHQAPECEAPNLFPVSAHRH